MKSIRKTFVQLLRSALRRKHLFLILNGFLLATILYFYSEDRYEQKLFEALANHVHAISPGVNNPNNKDSLIIHSLRLTHELGEQRVAAFGNQDINSFKSLLQPLTFDLMTVRGSCGSYSMVLSRILTELNINNRILQMKVNGIYGGHVIVEAETANDGWVVLDPSYNIAFKKPDGKLAGFNDVGSHWDFYSKQVPEYYNLDYRYEGLRYTNWTKIPVVMPLLKSAISLAIGKEKTDTLSLRTLFLRKYHMIFLGSTLLYLLLLTIVFVKYLRRNRPIAKPKPAHSPIIPGMQRSNASRIA